MLAVFLIGPVALAFPFQSEMIMMIVMMMTRLMMMVMTMRLMMMEVKETALQTPLPRLRGSNGPSDWIINPPATLRNPLNTTNKSNSKNDLKRTN